MIASIQLPYKQCKTYYESVWKVINCYRRKSTPRGTNVINKKLAVAASCCIYSFIYFNKVFYCM